MTIYKLAIGTNGQVTSREKVLFVLSETGKANWLWLGYLVRFHRKKLAGGETCGKVSANENRGKVEYPDELQICEEPYEKGAI